MAIDYITPKASTVERLVEKAKQLGWKEAHRASGRYVQVEKGNNFAIISQAGDRVSVTRTMGNNIDELVENLKLIGEHDPRYDEWISKNAGRK